MIPRLPASFLERPIAHRAFHDAASRRPENSLAAVRAAVERGYGIEIDIQPSADGQAMVFHDYDLDRLTLESGPVSGRTADELVAIRLKHGDEGIPRLSDVLDVVAGQVPLLIEIKDQDGALGPNVGALERAVAGTLAGYAGDVAVMSFNPNSVMAMRDLLPDTPRGLTTEDFTMSCEWPATDEEMARLAGIPDYDRVGASFISHDHRQLAMPRVAELKKSGAAILCWTVKSLEDETRARQLADNVTFEGYEA